MGACKGGGETWHSQLSRLIDYQKKFLWWWKCSLSYIRASQVVLMVKNHLPVQEMWVWSLCREDPLEKEIATHSSILVWKMPWTEEPGRLQSMGSQRVGHDWATEHTHSLCHWLAVPLAAAAQWQVSAGVTKCTTQLLSQWYTHIWRWTSLYISLQEQSLQDLNFCCQCLLVSGDLVLNGEKVPSIFINLLHSLLFLLKDF